MSDNETISSKFPFQPHYVDVHGSKLHYVEEGAGDPILFIHGVPTSCYLWRNIIPQLANNARCIAVDMIGFGQSDKPDIDYSVFDLIEYLEGFINALELKNVTLVLHGWGSVVGFDYAMRNQDNIKGLAFFEAHLRTPSAREMVSLPVQELTTVLDAEDGGYDVIMNSNYYVNKVMPNGVLRQLNAEELAHYQTPFSTPGSCKPIWQYLQELPLGNEATPVVELINRYSEKLQQTSLPKLLMYAVPGFITTIDTVCWARDNLSNLVLVDLGDALHYAQESNPTAIAKAIKEWYLNI